MRYYYMTCVVFFIGCAVQPDKIYYKNKLQKTLDTPISGNFKIVKPKTEFNHFDQNEESFVLRFSEREFLEIFKHANPIKNTHFDTSLYSLSLTNLHENTTVIFSPTTLTIQYSYHYH